jgi:hypothetical protein
MRPAPGGIRAPKASERHLFIDLDGEGEGEDALLSLFLYIIKYSLDY